MTDWDRLNEALNPALKQSRRQLEHTTNLIQQHQPPIVDNNPFKDCCEKCGDSRWALFSLLMQNGSKVVQAFCTKCGTKDARAFPLAFIDPDLCPIYKDKREGVCMRCGTLGTERHHYAPHHLFQDSEQWGTIDLCPTHHKEWHQVVTPQMSLSRKKV